MFILLNHSLIAQEEGTVEDQLARAAFESAQLIDNHSSYVYPKGTLEMNIQHRFGLVNNGISDVFGIFGPSNIRMGFGYGLIDKLNVGFGYTKNKQYLDLNAKYAILQQTRSNKIPVNLTYYGNMAFDLRDGSNFLNTSDRVSFFHQLIVSRRITPKLSAQLAPSVSHFNVVEGYISREGEVEGTMKNNHYALHIGGRYKFSGQTSIIAGYDQPLTEHLTNNPHPNISFGVEVATSSHAFQIFFTNYNALVPQENNMFNPNDFRDGDFLIGFNITRLWSF
jgi:hypothetical protein